MLDILFWAVITLLALSVAANIMLIGQPREPITPGSALATLIVNSLIIGVLLWIYQRGL